MITKTMLLGGLLTFGAGAATQEVVLSGQRSFFAVELEVGENRVGDIFPIAPEGSVIFTYDNAEGYQASTRLESGWTNPEMKIEAGEGAIFWKEDPGTLQFTLQGNEPGQDFELHAGWNLVSEGSVSFPAGSEAGSRDGDQIVSRAGNQWQTNVYSGTTGEWETEFTPTSGRAVWFYTEAWPENPAGTFELQQALYLNPPWGLRFPRNQTGCLPENATLQVLLLTDHTMVRTQLGDLAPVDELGMVPDVANPFRYIPFHANVATNELVFFSGEEAIAVQNTGKVLPSRFVPNFPEIAAWIGSPVSLPRIVSQPVSANPELGSAAELRAVYNYPGSGPNPDPTTSLEATGCGGDADCVIQYQWLKQTGAQRLE